MRWAKNGGEPIFYASLEEFRRDEPNYETHTTVLAQNSLADTSKGDFRLPPKLKWPQAPLPADIAALARPSAGPSFQKDVREWKTG